MGKLSYWLIFLELIRVSVILCHSFIETKMKMTTAAAAAAWRHAHVSPQPPTAILSITLLGADSRDPRDRKCIPTRSTGRRAAAVRRVGPTDRAINVIELAAIGAPLKHASNVRPSCLDLQLIFNCTAPSKYVTDAKSLKPASVELVLHNLSLLWPIISLWEAIDWNLNKNTIQCSLIYNSDPNFGYIIDVRTIDLLGS